MSTENRITLTESQFRSLIESVYTEGFVEGWSDGVGMQHESAAQHAESGFYWSRSKNTMESLVAPEGMGDWRPLESAPKDGTWIALWNGHEGEQAYDIGCWCGNEWNQSLGHGDMRYWRPLKDGEYEVGPYGFPLWTDDTVKVR